MSKIGKPRNRFHRSSGTLSYRKVFHIVTEGERTEPRYFRMLKQQLRNVHLELHPSDRRTSANQILQLAKKVSKEAKPIDDDVWVVVDVDDNTAEDLELLIKWSEEQGSYGLALSNPKFEYWLLLHFEEAKKVQSSDDCDRRLDKHLNGYSKSNFDPLKLRDKIQIAIAHATEKYKQCESWFDDYHTTVYQLVVKILNAEENPL